MSKNIDQVFIANPITTNASTDLMYFGQSPYGVGDDAAMTYANFAAQFTSGTVTPAQVQQSAFNVGVDSGVADAYVITLSPNVTVLTQGLVFSFVPLFTNATDAPTLKVGTTPITNIVIDDASFLNVNPGDIVANQTCNVQYDGTSFILLNPKYSAVTYLNLQKNVYWTSDDTGTTNAYVWTSLNNSVLVNPDSLGAIFVLNNLANSNTGASTLTVNPQFIPVNHSIRTPDGQNLVGGEMLQNKTYLFMGNSSGGFILLNSSLPVISPALIQQDSYNIGIDSGSSTDYVVTMTPPISAYTDGLRIIFKPLNASSTETPTLNIDGVGAINIVSQNALNGRTAIGDIDPTQDCVCIFSSISNVFTLLTPCISVPNAFDMIEGLNYWTGQDQNVTPNDYAVIIPFTAAYPSLGPLPIFLIMEYAGSTNTGASTMSIAGGYPASVPMTTTDGQPLVGGEIVAGFSYFCVLVGGSSYIIVNPSSIPKLITAPPASSSSAIAIGSAFQNTLGYDAVFTIYLSITAATAASVLLGVGSTSTPTQQTIMSGITLAALDVVSVPIYIPSNYYCLLSTSGTITLTISGQMAMPV